MALITCRICRKFFNSVAADKRICPDCRKRLEKLYPDVHEYLRDNAKTEFNVESLAEAVGADVKEIQGLIDLGYLERDLPEGWNNSDEASREKLARAFEKSLEKMKATSAQQKEKIAANNSPSYGQSLYGNQGKRR